MRYIYIQLLGLFLILFGIVNFTIWYFTNIEFCLFATISISPGIYHFYKHAWTKRKSEYILVISLVMLVTLTTSVKRLEKHNDLFVNGIVTKGTILSKDFERLSRSTNYYAIFRFETKEGVKRSGRSEIRFGQFMSMERGDSIYVMYSETNSRNFIISKKPINPLRRWSYIDAIWKGKGGLRHWISVILGFSVGALVLLVLGFSIVFFLDIIIRLIK